MSDVPTTGASTPPSAAPTSTPAAAPTSPGKISSTAAPTIKGVNDAPASPKTEASTTAGETSEAKREAERRRYKQKVDGQEFEEELTDDEVAIRLQKSRAAEKRMAEAAELRKKFASFVEHVKSDPFEALKDEAFGGVDLMKLAEERLAEKYREELMPEGEREKARLQKELERYKAQETQRQQAERQAAQKEYEAKVAQQMESEFVAALESSDLPKTRETLYMMAEVARLNLDHGLELTPAQMAAEVRHRLSGINQQVVRGLRGEALAKYLGDDVVKELLKYSVSKVRTPAATPSPFGEKPTAAGDDTERNARQMRTLQDWRKAMRE